MVAFTTLCGCWLPIDLVSTLGIPHACTTRAPDRRDHAGAVLSRFQHDQTRAEPAQHLVGMVLSSRCTRRRFFLAASMPLRIADGTSWPCPRRTRPRGPTDRQPPPEREAHVLAALDHLGYAIDRDHVSFRLSDCESTRFTVTAGMRTPVLSRNSAHNGHARAAAGEKFPILWRRASRQLLLSDCAKITSQPGSWRTQSCVQRRDSPRRLCALRHHASA